MGLVQPRLKSKGCLINTKTQEAFEIYNGITLGRSSDANVVIDDRQVSRIHLTIYIDSSGVISVQDFSSNGTFIDGERVEGKIKLTKDVKLKLGSTEMMLAMPVMEAPAAEKSNPIQTAGANKSTPQLKLIKNFSESYENYPPGSFLKRVAANALDSIILGLATQVSDVILTKVGLPVLVAGLTSYTISMSIYCTYYFKTLGKNGQTIGKKAMKLKVVSTDSDKDITKRTIFLRELIYKTIFLLISIPTALFSKKKLAAHDYLTKTRVIDISGN